MVIDDYDLLYVPEAAEFVVQVAFHGADAESEHAQHIGRVRRLLSHVSTAPARGKQQDEQWEREEGAFSSETCGKYPP